MSNIPTIEELLRDAKRAGASDVHITVGIPPKMRVNGQLITMNYDRLLPPDTLQMLDQFMDERQRAMICLFLFRIWEDTVSMRTVREVLWQLHCGLSEPRFHHLRCLVCRSQSLTCISVRKV